MTEEGHGEKIPTRRRDLASRIWAPYSNNWNILSPIRAPAGSGLILCKRSAASQGDLSHCLGEQVLKVCDYQKGDMPNNGIDTGSFSHG
jgi:hypothetical protein